VGFALESQDVVKNALKKLSNKHLDLVVANKVNGEYLPFGSGKTSVWFCDKYRGVKKLEHVPKSKVAKHLLDRVEELCYFRKPN
jgi:phosphopantothenoylcysteine decarboxylase/phosphopantothenate--cysteine ligase